jgi:nucleoside-diphosphate-sugar epimerase
MAQIPQKVIIFGANGYLGRRILHQAATAIRSGTVPTRYGASSSAAASSPSSSSSVQSHADGADSRPIICVCRTGPAAIEKLQLAPEVAALTQWVSADCIERPQVQQVMDEHKDATAVINAIGLMTLNHQRARRVNGDVTSHILASEFRQLRDGVRKDPFRYVYVSAADLGVLATSALHGYYEGKLHAERAVLEHARTQGLILRPGPIHGVRAVTSRNIPLPLNAVLAPMEMVFKHLHARFPFGLLTPPVSVDVVAKAACFGALAPPGAITPEEAQAVSLTHVTQTAPVLEYPGLQDYARRWDALLAAGAPSA